jgi:hypothetical protein
MFSQPAISAQLQGNQPGQLTLTWPSVPNLLYDIQGTTNLSDGFTAIIQSSIPATPPTNAVTVPAINGNYFYRLSF